MDCACAYTDESSFFPQTVDEQQQNDCSETLIPVGLNFYRQNVVFDPINCVNMIFVRSALISRTPNMLTYCARLYKLNKYDTNMEKMAVDSIGYEQPRTTRCDNDNGEMHRKRRQTRGRCRTRNMEITFRSQTSSQNLSYAYLLWWITWMPQKNLWNPHFEPSVCV